LLVSSAYTLTHTLLTIRQISTTLLVIRVPAHMMLVSSTAHMFLSKWFVPLVRTPSSLKLALRPDMVLLQTHSQRALLLPILVFWKETPTFTTEESRLQTLCDQLDTQKSQTSRKGGLFLSK